MEIPAEKLHERILVTGGTGFLGSYLLRYLVAAGFTDVHALYRPDSRFDLVAPAREQVHWHCADVLDVPALEEAMEGVTAVYHCAAVVSFDPQKAALMRQVNKDGTANVVNVALDAGVSRLLHVSSIAAIGRDKKERVIDEQTKWSRSSLNTTYAISKYLGEQEAWRGEAEGLDVVVVNPSVIIGSGYWDEGPQRIFGTVQRGFPFYPVGQSGFVDVRDVAHYMVRLMNSGLSGERYLLNGENRSFRDLMASIAAVLGSRPPRWALPTWMGYLLPVADKLAAALLRRPRLFTRETVRNTSLSYEYRNDKSLTAFPFSYTPLSATLTETAKQFQHSAKAGFALLPWAPQHDVRSRAAPMAEPPSINQEAGHQGEGDG